MKNNDKVYADLMISNGNIATLDERGTMARAVAVKDGKILAVGSDEDVAQYKGPDTQVIDAGKKTVIPGLNDSHLHVIRGGLNYNMELRWERRALPGGRHAHAQGAGPQNAAGTVGARGGRLERVPVCRTPDAYAGGD